MLLIPANEIFRYQFRDHQGYIEAFEAWHEDPSDPRLQKEKELEYYRMMLTKEEFARYEKSVSER